MSGGRLVVLDRAGRDVKRFPLAEGLATLGSDPACDIRIMLPTVSPHHATVVVHANQTVVRNVCSDETHVNGRLVSVAALQHGDVIGIGGRQLRWEYADPARRRPQAPQPALHVPRRTGRAGRARRGSGPAGVARDPALLLAREMSYRASMPGSAGGKQVAIVQPQRRDTSEQIDKNPPRSPQQANKRARTSKTDLDTSASEEQEKTKRKSTARLSPKNSLSNLQTTTKATLWIESRKTSPRKSSAGSARRSMDSARTGTGSARTTTGSARTSTGSARTSTGSARTSTGSARTSTGSARRSTGSARKATPLRLTVLKRAQSASKMTVTKIEGPLKMDHTKQAAIRLMTGHTPKPKPSSPSFVVKKPSPVRRTPRSRNSRATVGNSRATVGNSPATLDNSRATLDNSRATSGNTSTRRSGDRTATILEITDSDEQNSSLRNRSSSRRSGQKSPKKSFRSLSSTSPRKSALKDPSAKRGVRKTESIKFDLSNLENNSQHSDVLMLSDETRASRSDDDVTLRYSPSPAPSPSPRRSIHSRSSRMLQSSLGASVTSVTSVLSPPARTLTPQSPRSPKRSARGSLILQKALDETETSSYSRRSTKSVSQSDNSRNTTVATAYRTRTLSPCDHLESYSIVDLVSIDTDESALSASVYNSAGSTASTAFGTPQNTTGRKTRSTIDPRLLSSSTPYVKGSALASQSAGRSSRSGRSKSLTTPDNSEDTKKHISVNSTRISRASRSRSRLNDSELLLLDEDDDSPRTSKRITTSKSSRASAQTELSPAHGPAQHDGTFTPENRHSPEEASTPVLSIQSLLESSQSSFVSQKPTKRGRPSFNTKRKTIGGVTGAKTRVGAKSKSLSFSARKTRLRLSSGSVEVLNKTDDSEIVTPKSAVKLVPEGVKNKHSTAKKPQSKRSIIDDLNESDIVKQLFNSPVKRKLSQSMTEFSRKQLFDDDDFVQKKRPTRNTIAITGRTPDNSLLDHTESYTPEIFVSPISTPTRSPSLDGIKLMFAKTTPENDLRNVRGVKRLLRTPRTRRSIKNDLTNVSGVKQIFAKSPKNRLSDVRVKEVFVSSPKNDLRRVTGVKSLFHTTNKRKSPRNELDDVRGVKKLFNTKSPANDLRNVSGVKRTLRRQSPRNDLSDVRGVKRMFRGERRNDLSDVSGVEELFNLSNYSSATVSTRAESLFDQLVGKPQIRAVYSKTFSSKPVQKNKNPRGKSLHASLDKITAADNNWLEQELDKRLQIKNYLDSLKSANTSKVNRSKANKSKSLHASLDEVTDVDVLLDQELNKEQQINKYLESMRSVNDSKANKSKVNKSRVNKSKANISKANVSRELLKLVTETVEGDTPLRTSRIRSSIVVSSHVSDAERKKSASQLHLPIKKRSLVDVSRGAAPHSTPLKARAAALDASVLARVSPIRAHSDTHGPAHDTHITSTQPQETTKARPKSTRGTRANTEHIETAIVPEIMPSPKKTRGKVRVASPIAKPTSPVKEKTAAKGRKASPEKAKVESPAKAKKTSPVKTKKASPIKAKKASPAKAKKSNTAKARKASPAKAKKASPAKAKKASPAKAKKASPAKAKKASPVKGKKASPAKGKAATQVKKASPAKKLASPVPVKTTRSRRNNVSALESNTKKRGASLVVAKKSPVMSPKPSATRKRKEPETTTTPIVTPKKTRGARKNESVKDDKPKTPKNTRAKVLKATVVVSKPSPQLKPRATRRGQTDLTEQEPTRKTRKTVAVQDKPESPKKSQVQSKSSSKTKAAQVQPKTRGRKTVASDTFDSAEVEKPKAKAKNARKTEEPAAKKTRNNKQEKSIEEPKPVKTRGKKVEPQESVESAPSARGRRAAKSVSIAPEVKTRKRKSDTAPDNEIPSKVRKSKEVAKRGRLAAEVSTETKSTRSKSAVKESKAEKVSDVPVKVARGRKTAEVEPAKATKQTEQKTRGRKANIENVPANKVTEKRKRQAAAEPSPVKERKTRATRGNTQPEGKPAGRARRR